MVDKKISSQTFMDYNELKDGLNYIYSGLITKVAIKIYQKDKSQSVEMLKNDIANVYNRRNMIAHQNDREHINGLKKDISLDDVDKYKRIIEKTVETILYIIKNEPPLNYNN